MNIQRTKTQFGFTVVEAVAAIAVFSIIGMVGYTIHIRSNDLLVRSDMKSQALSLAEEGIEATRNIRDNSFANLTDGTKGLALSGGAWSFSGTSDVTNGTYYRSVIIGTGDADTKYTTSTVSWSYRQATTTVTLATALTNWQKSVSAASSLTIDASLANLSLLSLSKRLNGIVISNTGSSGSITITKITLTWTTSARRLTNIYSPSLTQVFGTASLTSGTAATLTSPIVLSSGSGQVVEFLFNGAMTSNTITITFTMSDNTTKAVTVTNPPTGL